MTAWGLASVVCQQASKERRPFLRRTKATAPPVTADEDTNLQTSTSKYTRRGENKFKTRKTEKVEKSRESNTTDVQPSLNDTAPSNERPNRNFVRRRFGGVSSSTTSTTQSSVTRRAFRVASRRRLFSTTTTTTTSTSSPTTAHLESEESLQDIGDTDAIEEPSLQSQLQPRKATNVQRRRPLVQLKSANDDQNSSATNEEEKRRQSKKYSASFKQNQLYEILKLRASAEEVDVTTEGRTTIDDTSVETAVALAAHQLLAAPIPIIPDYDDESKPARTSQTIIDYKFTSPQYSDLTKTQSYSEDYSRTPAYTSPRQRFESSTAYTSLQTDSDPRSSTSGALTETNLPSGFTTTGSFTSRFSRPTTGTNTVNPTSSGITLSLGSEGSGESTARYTNYPTDLNPSIYTTGNYESRTLRPGLSTNIINPTSLNLRESTANVYTALDRNVQPTYASTFSAKVSRPTGFSPNLVNIDEIEGHKSTVRYQGSIERGPSTARYQGSSEKISVPVAVGYSTGGQGLQEPSYFTKEYLLESPVTRTYDDEYQYLSPVTIPQTTSKKPLRRKTVYRRISSTHVPSSPSSPAARTSQNLRVSPTTPTPTTALTHKPRRTTRKPFQRIAVKKAPIPTQEVGESVPKDAIQKTLVLKINNNSVKPVDPISEYDYYDDSKEKGINYEEGTKVLLHEKGDIECLDIGNFAHPTSCKMFISCARTKGGPLSGWEYICPKGLSFDPVGGICNWSAGLGCNEKDA